LATELVHRSFTHKLDKAEMYVLKELSSEFLVCSVDRFAEEN